ncbi:preprotein translocase subunit Sec61beta [Candidatus Woesearchaeota archaeon]|jgi:preprotein translocase subunit Sec61beta|nr:preprotein translocase subunit Sec61beta [Candidatus Woesearchaeota archaeon]MBT4835650.1 preprotein translocase subunit Sec61beta [Candidatus Woesearchaeota archaeon]MBT6734998.1 preprotein translocase subunit Sec61beta [Candidatus Woesearchaeota archaeon]MBT7170018.1 preprotein translocase subunit Sec61beta [Candidatus Woesearchaeota archaeon]MBT7474725.1 preprotein translocase subunit Sec61beta [Candidatus Woesearchaeota archaeon]
MADNKIQLPSGMGGLIRYSENSTSNIQFKPGTIVLFIILVIIIEIMLHTWGGKLI